LKLVELDGQGIYLDGQNFGARDGGFFFFSLFAVYSQEHNIATATSKEIKKGLYELA